MTASVVLFDGRASFLDEGRAVTLEAARRRTRAVRALRALLLLAMAGLGAGVGFFVVSSAINPPIAIDPSDVGGQVRMINPRFTGRDSGGTPYVISAQSAERPGVGAAPTELAFPRLDFSGQENPSSVVQAERGVFDQAARTLDLHDGVRFRTDNGYVFETEQARVYVDEGRVVGERLVLGEGPMGSIRAQSFEIREGGDSVTFNDEVVARLYVDRADEPELRAPEDDGSDEGADAAADGADATGAVDAETETPPLELRGAAPATESDAPAVELPEADPPRPRAQFSRQGGPIDITADSTEFISSENVNRWAGEVNVTQGDARLLADRMDVFFASAEGEGAREIERIDATGSVAYVTPEEIARGDRGVYVVATERIMLTGDVNVIRGDSTLSGQELIIEPREGRSTLSRGTPDTRDDGSRVRGSIGSADPAANPSAPASPSDSD